MSDWIKCSERKPEIGKRVLVCSYIGILKKEPFIGIGTYDDYITGEALCFSCFSSGGHIMSDQPVLWKPLPTAPPWDAVKE